MGKPLIGITAGEAQNKYYPTAPKVYGQQYTYIEAIERAGGTPLIIPIVEARTVLKDLYQLCDGIVLAGGNDINPKHYGAKASRHTHHHHDERDAQEFQIWQWAKADNRTVLAVCRGMQLINVAEGGNLYQDIPTDLPKAAVHRIETDKYEDREHQIVHHLRLESTSKLSTILGTTPLPANSYHHQAIRQLGSGLVPTMWSEDGLIEGIEMPRARFVIGVQAHPEALEADIETRWRKLFTAFVDAAR